MILGLALKDFSIHQETELSVHVLSSYLPAFRKRALDQKVDSLDCLDIYTSLGEAMAYLHPLRIDEPPQWEMAEVAVLALTARTGRAELLLYPTSPREEASNIARLNHDSYFLRDGDKIPIQQKLIKSDKVYDEWITMLTLQPIIDKGMKKYAIHDSTNAEKMNHILSCIIAEVHGIELLDEEKALLDYISSAIVSHGIPRQPMRQAV